MTKAELLQSAQSLPADERADLAMDLWDTLSHEEAALPISPALREELRRRAAADEADSQPAENWDELKAKLLRGDF